MNGWKRCERRAWGALLWAWLTAGVAWADAPARDDAQWVSVAHTFHLLVSSEAQARELYRQIMAKPKAKRFKAFQMLAQKHSIDGGSARSGGDLGLVYQGQMVMSFEREVMGSEPLVVIAPFKSEFGWHLAYVTEMHQERVSDICRDTLAEQINHAREADKPGLMLAQTPPDPATLADRVRALIGPDWTGPYTGGDGNLMFIMVRPETSGENIRTVVRHVEYLSARLAASHTPLGCSRSMRDEWAFDCRAETIGFSAASEYEGRGASGRRTAEVDVPLPQIRFHAVDHGNSEVQLYNFACRRLPLLTPVRGQAASSP